MNTIRQIRKSVFNVTQAEFAAMIGVGQSSVSRWESGVEPTRSEMAAIRAAAIERGHAWDDRWFFDAPAGSEAA